MLKSYPINNNNYMESGELCSKPRGRTRCASISNKTAIMTVRVRAAIDN